MPVPCDPACLLLRLVACGHDPHSAEHWAARCAGWDQAPRAAIDAFAHASARLFDEIAREDPRPWKQQLARAAARWMAFRANAD